MSQFLEVVNLGSLFGSLVFGTVVGMVYGWRLENRGDLYWLSLVVSSYLILRGVYNLVAADPPVPVGRSVAGLVLWLVCVAGIAGGHRIRRAWVARKVEREVRNGG